MDTNNKDDQKLPMFTPKNSDGSQRVIKQIMVIDPNKLRVSGLDLKMAEALKKAKGRIGGSSSGVHSKEQKLALVKDILNKKLKQAQRSKEVTKHASQSQLSDPANAADEAARKISFSNTARVPTSIPQIKVAALKSLMPPPTMVFNFQKYDQKTGAIELDIVNLHSGHQKKIESDQIPKASIKKSIVNKKPEVVKRIEDTKVISSEVKFKIKKRVQSNANEVASIPQNLSPKDKETRFQVKEHPTTNYVSLVPKKHLPKVIDSKILSQEEKIDLRTLCAKSPTKIVHAAVPLAILKQRESQQKIALDISNTEAINKNKLKGVEIKKIQKVISEPELSAVKHIAKNTSSVPMNEESAVDFINNLSHIQFESNSRNESKSKAEIKGSPIGEDATSFLMSIFGQQAANIPIAKASASSSNIEEIPEVTSLDKRSKCQIVTVLEVNKPKLTEPTIKCEMKKTSDSKKTLDTNPLLHVQKTTSLTNEKLSFCEEEKSIASDTLKKSTSLNLETEEHKKQPGESSTLYTVKKLIEVIKEDNNVHTSMPIPISNAPELSSIDRNAQGKNESQKSVKVITQVKQVEDSICEISEAVSEVTRSTNISIVKETPSTSTHMVNTRRKGKKLVPVLIAKLNRNRKPPALLEKSDNVNQSLKVSSVTHQMKETITEGKSSVADVSNDNSIKLPIDLKPPPPPKTRKSLSIAEDVSNESSVKLPIDLQEPDQTVEKNTAASSKEKSQRNCTIVPIESSLVEKPAPKARNSLSIAEDVSNEGSVKLPIDLHGPDQTVEKNTPTSSKEKSQQNCAIVPIESSLVEKPPPKARNSLSIAEDVSNESSVKLPIDLQEPGETGEKNTAKGSTGKSPRKGKNTSTVNNPNEKNSTSSTQSDEHSDTKSVENLTKPNSSKNSGGNPIETAGSSSSYLASKLENQKIVVDEKKKILIETEPLPKGSHDIEMCSEDGSKSCTVPEETLNLQTITNSLEISRIKAGDSSSKNLDSKADDNIKLVKLSAIETVDKKESAPQGDKTVLDSCEILPEGSDQVTPPTNKIQLKEDPVNSIISRTPRSRKKTPKFEEYSKSSKKILNQSATEYLDSSIKEAESMDATQLSTSIEDPFDTSLTHLNLTISPVSNSTPISSLKLPTRDDNAFKLLKNEKTDAKMIASVSICQNPDVSDESDRFDESDSDLNLPVTDVVTATKKVVPSEDSTKQSLAAMDKTASTPGQASNPFRKVKTEKDETNFDEEKVQKKKKSVDMKTVPSSDDTGFLGFNEKEIEEGQQSTTLRLSQSEDAAPHQITSPTTGGNKKKSSIQVKKRLDDGKMSKTEQKNWKKNSAASLKNWLKPPDAGLKDEPGNSKQHESKEINSSIPLKKRRNREQNISESIKSVEDTLLLNDMSTPIKKRGAKPRIKKKSPEEISAVQETSADKEQENSSCRSGTAKPVLNKLKSISKTQKIKDENEDGLSLEENFDKLEPDSTPKKKKSTRISSRLEKKEPTKAAANKNASAIEKHLKLPEEVTENFKTASKSKSRKRKKVTDEENTSDIEPSNKILHMSAESVSIFTPPSSRPRGRRIKLEAALPRTPKLPVTVPVSPLEKKFKNDAEFNPRLLLIRNREDLKTDTSLIDPDMQTVPKNKDDVQCALCMGYTEKKKWLQHVSGHYGIGWIMGSPPPLNVKSRASVLNFMVEFFKSSKVKGLNCRLCQAQRRSALGLLVHLEQCGMTEAELKESRVECEHCNVVYSRTSIVVHVRSCAALLKKTKPENEEEQKTKGTANEEEVLSNTGRLKRKSVIKAEIKFKNLNDVDFIPDELIKHIPQHRTHNYPSTWLGEIKSFGKGFCVQKKCPFTATTVKELQHHCKEGVCSYFEKPGYLCMKCKFHDDKIEAVRTHVLKNHKPKPSKDFEDSGDEAVIGSESSSSDAESLGDEENENEDKSCTDDTNEVHAPKKRKKTKKFKSKTKIKKNVPTKDFKKLMPDRDPCIASIVKSWYIKFVQQNYSENPLFNFAKPCATQADYDGYESYYPKSPISMKFAFRNLKGFVKEFGKTHIKPDEWQQLERLKGAELPSEHITYMGGPIKCIAWAPLDPSPPSLTQYLAIATKKSIDKFTRFVLPKHSRSLIYVYKYNIKGSSEVLGEIYYALAIDKGPVHCIEFLPSGGYAPEMNRLGLLAVGTIDTEIKIYSLPLNVNKSDCDIFPIIRLEPSIMLCVELAENPNKYSDQYKSQCISLVWSQTAGHNYVIGGYLNGFVAIWDISDEDDNLNRFVVNGLRKFVPGSYFWTLDDRIKQIAAHYDMNGLRWLAVVNSTRKLHIYDLREISKPVLFYMDTTKNVCNSIDWPVVWENPSYGLGDALPSHGACINTISPMSLVYVNRRFDRFCCGVNDIHFNIWNNFYAAGADNGDIHLTMLREAVLDVGLRMKIDEKTIATLDIVPLDGGVISKNTSEKLLDGWRLFDTDCKEKYGLVFGSIQRIIGGKNPELYGTKRIPSLNLSRLMRVNRLRFNLNRNANSLLAVGYDNGFLRVIQSDWNKTLKNKNI